MNLRAVIEAYETIGMAEAEISKLGFAITARQASILALMNACEGGRISKMGMLADRLGVTPAVITGMADRLERSGLIEREHVAGDRRSVSLRITEAGRNVLPIVERALAAT